MILLLSILFIFTSLNVDRLPSDSTTSCKNSRYILKKSKAHHDPNENWEKTELAVHIQEPRVGTPLRYTKLIMNNGTSVFSLIRDSEIGEINRLINASGEAKVLVDGHSEFSKGIKEKYGLGEDRNFGYRSFYQLMYGLPMSLTDHIITDLEDAKMKLFNDQKVYVIAVELQKPMISKQWELLIAAKDYKIKGLRFVHSDEENELIMFDGSYSWNDISIPRFRHWYLDDSNEYLGSDVIVGDLK